MREHASGGRGDEGREDRGGRGDGGGRESDGGREGGGEKISRWEWLTAAVGLLLVLGAMGYMGYEAVAGDDEPPLMVVDMDSVTTTRRAHVVHFTVHNEGDRAGAAVVVEGRLTGAGGEEETSEATLDYVPGRSERRGGLLFSSDPRAGRLELRAHGYAVP